MRHESRMTVLGLLALSATAAVAEVRVITDRDGAYQMTQVVLDARTGRVWTAPSRGEGPTVLNEGGDRNGDLYPRILESSVGPHYPWVVWSRYNVHDEKYDLAWSRWSEAGWEPIRWLEPEASPGDNLDAALGFDAHGRPYVAWWREDDGHGQVYLSVYLVTSWMAPFPVSSAGVDSRHPSLDVPSPGVMIVRYETPAGTVEETVLFDAPVTITDDINPLDYVHSESRSLVED
jgi:hypothetical protein